LEEDIYMRICETDKRAQFSIRGTAVLDPDTFAFWLREDCHCDLPFPRLLGVEVRRAVVV